MRKNVTAVRVWGKRECNEKGTRPLEETCAQKKKHEIRGLSECPAQADGRLAVEAERGCAGVVAAFHRG